MERKLKAIESNPFEFTGKIGYCEELIPPHNMGQGGIPWCCRLFVMSEIRLTIASPKARLPWAPTGKLGSNTGEELYTFQGRIGSAGRPAWQKPRQLSRPSDHSPIPPLLGPSSPLCFPAGSRMVAACHNTRWPCSHCRRWAGAHPATVIASLLGLLLLYARSTTPCKPGPHGHPAVGKATALGGSGKRTSRYHLLPQLNLSVGHAGIPLSTVGAAQRWQEVLPTGRGKPSAVPMCPFSDSLRMARRGSGRRAGGGSCPSKTADPARQTLPCWGAAKAPSVLDISGTWVSLPIWSRKQSCVKQGAKQLPGSRSSGKRQLPGKPAAFLLTAEDSKSFLPGKFRRLTVILQKTKTFSVHLKDHGKSTKHECHHHRHGLHHTKL